MPPEPEIIARAGDDLIGLRWDESVPAGPSTHAA
jgi:hypothetical protein